LKKDAVRVFELGYSSFFETDADFRFNFQNEGIVLTMISGDLPSGLMVLTCLLSVAVSVDMMLEL
jgi:hypothetical protein